VTSKLYVNNRVPQIDKAAEAMSAGSGLICSRHVIASNDGNGSRRVSKIACTCVREAIKSLSIWSRRR